MSNKLTSKKIDQLILEVLNEDVYSMDDLFSQQKQKQGKVPAKGKPDLRIDTSLTQAVKDLGNAVPPPQLSDEDLDYFKTNLDAVNTDVKRKLIAIKYATKNTQVKQKVISILNAHDDLVQRKSRDRQTISQPQIRSAGAESKQYTDEIGPLLKRIFKGGNPRIKARVEELSKISKTFYSAAGGDKTSINKIKDLDPRDFLAQVMLMDYFAEISKSFDAGSGAYLFEWFLAMIAGGQVTGKETGPGGGMGAVDFKWKGGKGSAKYYATKSDIKQAASGFNFEETVYYIVALKKQGIEQKSVLSRGTSDPSKLTMVDIYAPKVKRISDDKFEIDGEEVTVSGGKVPIGNNLGELISTIYVAEVPTKTFREMVYQAVSTDINRMKKELLSTFEGFFQQLKLADTSCRKYSISGETADASKTFGAIDKSRDQFAELVPKVNKGLQENKTKSLKDLDKLIEHVILNKMNK
jgi:hypothetical protein